MYTLTYLSTHTNAKKAYKKTNYFYIWKVGMTKLFDNTKYRLFFSQNNSSIGIGAMIVFIAMVLVAGIAASVLIQTSVNLETQAMATGHDTKDEVSSDIDVIDISGQYNTRTIDGTSYTRYHNLTIMVTPRSASVIDLGEVVVEIADENELVALTWSSAFALSASASGVFSTPNCFDLNANEFGIIVVEDGDGSCTSDAPTINRGDKAVLCVNLSACFNGIEGRKEVRGLVIPELGAPGIFLFRTPATTSRTVVNFL